MILSLFLIVAAVAAIAIVFEFVAEHLIAFFDLTLPSRTAFPFIISPFFAGGFPAFELPCHRFDRVTCLSIAIYLGDRNTLISCELRVKGYFLTQNQEDRASMGDLFFPNPK